MIDKDKCDDGFIWSPSICECECDKSYDAREYPDYANCKSRKMLIDKLVEDIVKNKTIYNATLYDYGWVCKSCTLYIVLIITFIIIMGISGASFYFNWPNKGLF